MQRKQIDKEKALERLMSLCSRGEQCEWDLVRKLINWGISRGDQTEIIEYLKENNYLDNERFARSYANDKARFSSWGPYKIRLELMKKRISGPVIKDAVEAVDHSVWKEGLLKNAESKSRNLDLSGEEGYENRQKLFRYLISRGFSTASSTKAVNLMKKRSEEREETD